MEKQPIGKNNPLTELFGPRITPPNYSAPVTEKATKSFGFNPTVWIFVVIALIIAIIPFVIPVVGARHSYYFVGNVFAQEKMSPFVGFISFAILLGLLGLLTGCCLKKATRTTVGSITAFMGFMLPFSITDKVDDVHAMAMIIVHIAACASMIYFARRPESELLKYPNPAKDKACRMRWLYAGLAMLAMLSYVLLPLGSMFSSDFYGGTQLSFATLSILHTKENPYWIFLFVVMPAIAAYCVFMRKNRLTVLLTALMYLAPVIYFIEVDSDAYKGAPTGIIVYIVITTAMLAMALTNDLVGSDIADSVPNETQSPKETVADEIKRSVFSEKNKQFVAAHKKAIITGSVTVLVLAAVTALVCAYNSSENRFQRGMIAFENNDGEKAAKELLSVDPSFSNYRVAVFNGLIAAFHTDNRELKVKALQKVADIGYKPDSEYICTVVGNAYWTGEFSPEVPADSAEAVEWMRELTSETRNNLADEMMKNGHYGYADELYTGSCKSPFYGLLKTKAYDPTYQYAADNLWNSPSDAAYALAKGDIYLLDIFEGQVYSGKWDELDLMPYLNSAKRQFELAEESKFDAGGAKLRNKYLGPIFNAPGFSKRIVKEYDFGPVKTGIIYLPGENYGVSFTHRGYSAGHYDEAANAIVPPMLEVVFDDDEGIVATEKL